MNEQGFVDKREADWQKLTKLCDKAEGRASKMTPEEVKDFIRLYRRASTDLSIARTRSTNLVLVSFLNDIVGRTYGALYRAPRVGFFRSLLAAIALSAQTFRRNKAFVFTSAAIFFGSAFFSYGCLVAFPATSQVLVPKSYEETFDHWKSGTFEERNASQSAMAWGMYASNNPKVSIVAGAVGAGTFGTLSIYMLFENGAILGSLAHEVAQVGKLDFLLSSIAPHGVPELSGAIVAGSAGLLLGWALVNPGRRSRGKALQAVGKDAIVLLSTSVILMFIAAPIEGFFSFNPHVPGFVKVTVALISVAAWATFWSRYGLSDEEKARFKPSAA